MSLKKIPKHSFIQTCVLRYVPPGTLNQSHYVRNYWLDGWWPLFVFVTASIEIINIFVISIRRIVCLSYSTGIALLFLDVSFQFCFCLCSSCMRSGRVTAYSTSTSPLDWSGIILTARDRDKCLPWNYELAGKEILEYLVFSGRQNILTYSKSNVIRFYNVAMFKTALQANKSQET